MGGFFMEAKVSVMPDYRKIGGESVLIRMLNFYKALGWDGKSDIDPTKIIISEDDWQDICKLEMDRAEEEYPEHPGDARVTAGLIMMNYGPSAENVGKGTVRLLSGWIKEAS
jgi:hypothetical protein